jgi:anaerobic selenocysteine-containing dehydrogenase
LPIRPGEDATLLAGMIRLILAEGRHDAAFCAQHTAGLEELRTAVEGFTPDHVARRTGLDADAIAQAARLFAQGPRGVVTAGTGPNYVGAAHADRAPDPLPGHAVRALEPRG